MRALPLMGTQKLGGERVLHEQAQQLELAGGQFNQHPVFTDLPAEQADPYAI